MERMKYFTCVHRKGKRSMGGVNCWPVRKGCPNKKTSYKGRHYIYQVQDCEHCTDHKKKEIN